MSASVVGDGAEGVFRELDDGLRTRLRAQTAERLAANDEVAWPRG